MRDKITRCIDVASENCPCYLSETGDCLTCSRLQGKDECDCDWTGVCIYNEFVLNGRKKVTPRSEMLCSIIDVQEIVPDYFIMKISADRGFVIKCLRPGIHVFVRNPKKERYYDAPMSLLDADYAEGSIVIGVRVLSVKTKSLISSDDEVIVRGPYRNGVIGLKRRMEKEKILIIASGAGIAPAVFSGNLLAQRNEVNLLLNDGLLEKKIVRQYIRENENGQPEEIIFRNFEKEDDTDKICNSLQERKYDDIVILGGDDCVRKFRKIASEYSPESYVAFSNNSISCCGEGICGACAHINKNGQRILTCKCADPRLIN